MLCDDGSNTHGLVEDSTHAINKELKVLRSMQTTEEVTKGVLEKNSARRFGHGIEYEY